MAQNQEPHPDLHPDLVAPGPGVLCVPQWADRAWLLHGFSTRIGGVSQLAGSPRSQADLNLGYTVNDRPEAVAANRSHFVASVFQGATTTRIPPQDVPGLVTLKQMHSGLSRRVGRTDAAERASLWGDGLITGEPGILLGIQTADCLPILVADTRNRAVAAFHAGWRGTLKGVVQRGVESMRREFGSNPEDCIAAIGPGIGSCCFAVGDEVREVFAAQFPYAAELFSERDKLHLDLVEANRRQLLAAGLPAESICALNECTSCQIDRFFSYRAERGNTGRMMAAIGVASG